MQEAPTGIMAGIARRWRFICNKLRRNGFCNVTLFSHRELWFLISSGPFLKGKRLIWISCPPEWHCARPAQQRCYGGKRGGRIDHGNREGGQRWRSPGAVSESS